MNVVSAVVVFVLIWWCVFFCVLPAGLSTQYEEQEQGMAPGSPKALDIKGKMLITTGISFVLWLIACGFIMSGIFDPHIFLRQEK